MTEKFKETYIPKDADISKLTGVKVLLMGESGTGKTHSIGTLVETGIEVFYFAYEQGTETLLGFWADRGLPIPKNLHIITVQNSNATFNEMADAVKQINSLPYETLKKIADPSRNKYNQLENFLRTFNKVTPDNSTESYGSVGSWDCTKAVVLDGLTGLADSAMKTVIGGKIDKDQKDWGLVQGIVENFLRKVTSECKCIFVAIAHVEREVDPNGGGVKLMPSLPGQKLAPKIPAMFSDVILTERKGTTWTWNTASSEAAVKTRNLPITDKISPDFSVILKTWGIRVKALADIQKNSN